MNIEHLDMEKMRAPEDDSLVETLPKRKAKFPGSSRGPLSCQEKGALNGHDCVLICKSETELDEVRTTGNGFIGLTSKMFNMKRLEEISTCYSSNGLEKMAFFQCMEEVEKVKCFLEENSSEQDPRPGKNEAKEEAWSDRGLEGRTPASCERPAALTERSTQKKQLSSEKEKVHKLNVENTKKTNTSLTQRSFTMYHSASPDGGEDFAPRTSTETRANMDEKAASSSLNGQENSRAGDDMQVAMDQNECPVFKGEKTGFQEDTGEREAEETGESTAASETVPAQCFSKEQNADKANGDQPRGRCVSSTKPVATSPGLGNPATELTVQNADQSESTGCSKRRVTEEEEESFANEDSKKSRIDVGGAGAERALERPQEALRTQARVQGQLQEPTGTKTSREPGPGSPLDDILAPAAPFDHRIVTAKQAAVNSFYTVSKTEVLGGGRFGQVHKCEEKATGLKLAAKIIKTRGMKDKEEVKNEINVMNQLDHVNLIQLYDAFESKNDIVLVLEYVDGGELFDRIIDDNYNLTELDTILFVKQICEGIRHMHQMYILHLDLKPENILCVNRDAKQIKIIDFGLARRYKPREKLKVNFGTPEFLAPEVVNYDFVSFPTDMWSVGVIAYMLLSGLSPFLGDNDAETLNNILACRWDLEDEEFQDISEEAREFISKLLIKEKSWRISASEALKHPWLADHKLHARLSAQKRKKPHCSSDSQNL